MTRLEFFRGLFRGKKYDKPRIFWRVFTKKKKEIKRKKKKSLFFFP